MAMLLALTPGLIAQRRPLPLRGHPMARMLALPAVGPLRLIMTQGAGRRSARQSSSRLLPSDERSGQ